MLWSIVPFVNNPDMTCQAAADLLRQTGGQARVLIVNNGATWEDRLKVARFVDLHGEACLLWNFEPALLSLAAVWNAGLSFVWESGEDAAIVANNDVRVTEDTWWTLKKILDEEKALLVTATGVEEEETLFAEAAQGGQERLALDLTDGKRRWQRGGPGFSCFMMSREGHEKYPFDEALTPAFCEDVDMHRRMILGGDGNRIFGTNVRYLHLGGQTLKAMTPERRAQVERAISSGSRAHYQRKWGGGANNETFLLPFTETQPVTSQVPDWVIERRVKELPVTTPALFEEVRRGW